MEISLLDVLGPVMIGPSSSHTAGAVKLARTAAQIAGNDFDTVHFLLHGSFAKTGKGHGTHLALLAGVLGLKEDDERIVGSKALAEERGLAYQFGETTFENCHENTVELKFYKQSDLISTIRGSSVGGGRICIIEVDDVQVELTAEKPTLIVVQQDKPGVVQGIATILAQYKLNIAVMRVSRSHKGEQATTAIETDETICAEVLCDIKGLPNVISVRCVQEGGTKS